MYYRCLSIGVSIDGQRPETTVETNPVCWKIKLGSLRRGFCDLFGTSCERTPGLGLASPICLASSRGGRRSSFEGSRWRPLFGYCETSVQGASVSDRYRGVPPGPQGQIANGRFVDRRSRATKRPLAIWPWGRPPGESRGYPPVPVTNGRTLNGGLAIPDLFKRHDFAYR